MATAEFPTQITTKLFRAVARKSTYLNGDLDNSNTTITVDSTTGFPSAGYITIDNETIYYTSTTATTFAGCTRGFAGTAVSHDDDTQVKYAIVAETINQIMEEVEAIQKKIGLSGELTNTTTIEYKLKNLPSQTGSTQVTNLNAQYLGGNTSGQFLLSGSTAADSSKLTNIVGATIIENNIEFTPDSFNLNNNNPGSLVDITGTSVAPRVVKVEMGTTDAVDLPAFKMPRSYNGGTVTWTLLYCASTASTPFDVGIQAIAAGTDAAAQPSYGTPVYMGTITVSATSGYLGFTSKDIAGASLGLTTDKINYVRILGGTTVSAFQIVNTGLRWDKG